MKTNLAIIDNMVVMVCFTVLAIVFGKWWIAIFAILFMNSVRTRYTPIKTNEEKE